MHVRQLMGLLCGLILTSVAVAAQPTPATYSLRYEFKPGQVAEFETQQTSTFNITAQSQELRTTNQLRMVKRWKVQEVGSDQAARIEVSNVEVQMIADDGRQRIELDSRDPEKQPQQFQPLLNVIGKPLGVVTVSPVGRVTKVTRLVESQDLTAGLANLCLPLPEEPVAVGDHWQRNYSLTVTRASGSSKNFAVRQRYKLKNVEGAMATVSYDTVLLAPIDDPQLEVQLAQQLPAGTFEFDRGRGLVVSHRQEIEKEVIGYAGPGTAMNLSVSFVERLRPTEPTADARP